MGPMSLTGWDLIGGKWPFRLEDVDPEQQLCWAVLRSAVAVLVDFHDYRQRTDADAVSIESAYMDARIWIDSGPDSGAPITLETACASLGIEMVALQHRLEAIRVKVDTFIDFIRRQRCEVCGIAPSDPDHWPNKSQGGTDDRVWPLCRKHHTERHNIGMRPFMHKYEVDPIQAMARLRERFYKMFDMEA